MKEFLLKLIKENIHVSLADGELSVKVPKTGVEPSTIQEIKSRKQDLIAYLDNLNKNDGTAAQEIDKVPEAAHYQLSNAQQRLWILNQFKEEASAYNIFVHQVLHGTYHLEPFERAIEAVIERHEILRTVFIATESGEVRQFILSPEELGFKVNFQDFRNSDNPEAASKAYIDEDSYRLYDLEKGPLFRINLLQLHDDVFIIYLNMHHIISDGWSLNILSRDIMNYYEVFNAGKPSQLLPLNVQYKDFSFWQSNLLEQPEYQSYERYWLDRFSGEIPRIDFPSGQQRPKTKTSTGRHLGTYLSTSLNDQIREFNDKHDGSLFMFMLAILNILVNRYTAISDIAIASPVAGRSHPDLEDQIGFYINVVVFRNQIKAGENFIQFFNRIRENVLEDFKREAYPYDKIIETLELGYQGNRTPLYDISLSFNEANAEVAAAKVDPRLFDTIVDKGAVASKSDIEFHVVPLDSAICFEAIFNSDIYDTKLIAQLLEHFKQLTASILKNPQRNLATVDFLRQEEKQELLSDFNQSKVDFPYTDSIVQVFQLQAAKHPDAVALVYDQQAMSYRELDERSNQLAACLQKDYAIKRGDIVAIQLNRDTQMMVAILGILKCGGAYVAIAPEIPTSRKAFIVEDTAAQLLLTETEFIFDIDFYSGTTLALDVEFEPSEHSAAALDLSIAPNDLAYIIYTSGSTGKPKGVMVEHAAILNTINSQIKAFSIQEGNKVLQFASFSFDASIWESFIGILSGASLYIINEAHKKSPQLLGDFIQENGIDFATLPPSYFNLLNVEQLAALKLLVTAGEPPSFDKIAEYTQYGTYYNAYGPTETSICASAYKIEKGSTQGYINIPIGKPIGNTEIFILNEQHQLQAKGVVGEIAVSGNGLARGYLNRPELTDEKFVDHPFMAGKKMYKTGDMGRWLENGNLEFIGRKDDQVKIRGHRVELGEIEHTIKLKEDIIDVVVLTKENSAQQKELVAYLVAAVPQKMDVLHSFLAKRLPDYMIPSDYVQLDKIPVTINGKVDKKALEAIDEISIDTSVAYVEPENELEEKMRKVWSAILEKERISMLDDFFNIGGNSLKATRLISEYIKAFNVKLVLKDLFDHRTLKAHAELVSASAEIQRDAIPRIEEAENYQLSDGQKRLWVLSQFQGGSVAYNIPSVFELTEGCDVANFRRAIKAVVNRHEILRTVFKPNEAGEIRQWVLPAGKLNLQVKFEDLSAVSAPQDRIDAYIKEDTFQPFDLAEGPLLRMVLFQRSDSHFTFYCNMHHIISDAWSMDILVKDVLNYYEAFQQGLTAKEIPLPIQYKDYAAWQQERITEGGLDESKTYWMRKLGDEIPVLDLPSAKKRPPVKTNGGASLTVNLPRATTTAVKEFVRKEEGSVFMTLVASWNAMLHRYTSLNDIVLGAPVNGRDHVDMQDQIGFYVNTLVLRNPVDAKDHFVGLYDTIKQNTLEAYSHQYYPFDRLVEDLNLKREVSRSPIFDIMLMHQKVEAAMEDLPLAPYPMVTFSDNLVAKFDLEISFLETPEDLSITLIYNDEVYERSMITALLQHYEKMLKGLLDDPYQSIGTVNYLAEDEVRQQVEAFSEIKLPADETVIDLFTQQVRLHPNNIALATEDKTISYQELEKLTNQFAHCLQEDYAVKANDFVAISLEKNEWAVIAILGILKAGATYVFIEPALPAIRQAYLLQDSAASLLISQANLAEGFRSVEVPKLIVDEDFVGENYKNTAVEQSIDATQLAYVLYTSGSTGKPKGVKIKHESLLNYLLWGREYYEHEVFNFGLFTSLSFDLTVTSLFLPLISGGKIRLFNPQDNITTTLRNYFASDCNSIKLTPSHISLLAQLEIESSSVSVAIVGGDALLKNHVQTLKEINPSLLVYNEYGPTEATVGCIVERVESEEITIGHPILNTETYILNEALGLEARGVLGEIHIGGKGLAAGYLNREALTAEKFVDHPFKAGAKLYRTGDLGKLLPNGNFAYAGRKDKQIKIQGNRVELGEIEQELLAKASVQEAAVLVSLTADGIKELVAYIVSEKEEQVAELRDFLASRIPTYMMPVKYVQIEALPLTVNGKLDQQALQALSGTAISSNTEYVAPTNEEEERLVAIFAKELQQDASEISTQDNFFDLGLNSIRLIKILDVINKEFDCNLRTVLLFQYPNISLLAKEITNNEEEAEEENIDFSMELEDAIDLMEFEE